MIDFKNVWQNVVVLSEVMINNPKKSVVATLLAMLLGYTSWVTVTDRVPAAVGCWYEASFTDNMPEDKWRFNWIPSKWEKQCQRKRGDGTWIAYSKATDVGMGEDDGEDVED